MFVFIFISSIIFFSPIWFIFWSIALFILTFASLFFRFPFLAFLPLITSTRRPLSILVSLFFIFVSWSFPFIFIFLFLSTFLTFRIVIITIIWWIIRVVTVIIAIVTFILLVFMRSREVLIISQIFENFFMQRYGILKDIFKFGPIQVLDLMESILLPK